MRQEQQRRTPVDAASSRGARRSGAPPIPRRRRREPVQRAWLRVVPGRALRIALLAAACGAEALAAVQHVATEGARHATVGLEARPVPASLPATVTIDPGEARALEIAYGFAQTSGPGRIEKEPVAAPTAPDEKAPSEGTFRIRVEGRGTPIDVERRHAPPPRGSRDEWHDVTIPIPPGSGPLTCTLSAEAPPGATPVLTLPVARFSRPSAPSSILISLDTLRADRLSGYGYAAPLTPHLDRLARRGATWSRCLATSNWTLPSHADLFTGLRPFEHGLRQPFKRVGPLDPRNPSWVEELRARGVETLAMTGDAYVSPGSGLERGFDRFHVVHTGMRQGLAALLPWLDRPSLAPFFLFFHTYDVHDPYARFNDAPLHSRGLGGATGDAASGRLGKEAKAAALLALYDDGVLGADAVFGLLDAQLRRRGLGDATIVVVADHGDHLGEEGRLGHGRGLEDPLLHVPLLARGPQVPRGVHQELVELRSASAIVAAAMTGSPAGMPAAAQSVATELAPIGHVRLSTPDGEVQLPSGRRDAPRGVEDLAVAYLGLSRPGINVFVSRVASRRGLRLVLRAATQPESIRIWPDARDGGSDPAHGLIEVAPGEGPVSIQLLPLPAVGQLSLQVEAPAGAAAPPLLLGASRAEARVSEWGLADVVLAPGPISLDEEDAARPQVWVVGLPEPVSRRIPLDEETTRHLKALGYLD